MNLKGLVNKTEKKVGNCSGSKNITLYVLPLTTKNQQTDAYQLKKKIAGYVNSTKQIPIKQILYINLKKITKNKEKEGEGEREMEDGILNRTAVKLLLLQLMNHGRKCVRRRTQLCITV